MNAHMLQLKTPPGALYAVGDIHGCYDLYQRIEARIARDAARWPGPALIVCLGDMIDRGPDSAALLAHLQGPAPDGIARLCLAGNHEWMMMDFLTAPHPAHPWLDHGGRQTLASYGVSVGAQDRPGRLRARLTRAVPARDRAFLRGLPLGLSVGRYVLTHAGYDSARPARHQDPDRLLRGAPGGGAGLTHVHGHVTVGQVRVGAARIATDLGACATGRLAALRLIPGPPDADSIILAAEPDRASDRKEHCNDPA